MGGGGVEKMSEKNITITVMTIFFIILVSVVVAVVAELKNIKLTAKKCRYDVYQNGVVIDTVAYKHKSCSSFQGGIGSGLYYKSISEVSK